MQRHIKGESKDCADVRRKIMTICDWQHFCKQIKWLKNLAEANTDESLKIIAIWEMNGCIDVTTATGKAEFLKVYSKSRNFLQ